MFSLSRFQKNLVQIFFDFFLIILAIQLTFLLHFESFEKLYLVDHWTGAIIIASASTYTFSRFIFFKSVTRYIGLEAILYIIVSALLSVGFLILTYKFFNIYISISVPIIYLFILTSMLTSSRIFVRYIYQTSKSNYRIPIAIYGAGAAGCQLAVSIQHSPKYKLTTFIDDNVKLQKLLILGVKVISRNMAVKMVSKGKIQKICLAIPSILKEQQVDILSTFSEENISLEIIPGLDDLLDGKLTISDTRPIKIEDLLGRSTVLPDNNLMQKLVTNKSVLISGAGGSIGSELCYQLIKLQPEKIVILDCNEFALYQVHRKLEKLLKRYDKKTEIIPTLANIQDKHILKAIFQTYKFDTIYHAAAYKHVPIVEHNIIEAIKNNVFGTLNILQCAVNAKVKNFTLISTDKAVRPTNIMGATKRVAELLCQGLATKEDILTNISIVRFGNVLGSSGSVIPKFEEQINAGGPITITHPEITRYFMSITEAAQLVIQAAASNEIGGQVFLLDMGKPVKILELAKRMINLTGAHPSITNCKETHKISKKKIIEIIFTGLRPGEKLYEEMLISDKSVKTSHPRIMREISKTPCANELEELLTNLWHATMDLNYTSIFELLKDADIGFKTSNDIVDYIARNNKNLTDINGLSSKNRNRITLLPKEN